MSTENARGNGGGARRSGIATLEYIVLIVSFAIGVPLIAAQVVPYLQGRTCEANEILQGDVCVALALQADDVSATTFKGVPVEVDLLSGASILFERVDRPRSGAALAQTSAPTTPDYIGLVGDDPLGDGGSEAIAPRLSVTRIGEAVLRSVASPRSLSLGTGRVDAPDASRPVVFDPLSHFEPLRSDERAIVEFDFDVAGPRGATASARASVTVLGFHAEDDSAVAASDAFVEIDVLANDHLIATIPGNRDEVRIVAVTQPTRGAVRIAGDRLVYTPGEDFADRPVGEVVSISFGYTIEHTSGALASAQVTIGVEVVPGAFGPNIVQIAIGSAFRCARSDVGEIWCWGANGSGQLGRGFSGGANQTPRRVVHPTNEGEFLRDMIHLSAGNSHACAVSRSSHVYCWGSNSHGQIGDGWVAGGVGATGNGGSDAHRPRRVITMDGSPLFMMDRVALGGWFSCAHTRGGLAYCWGWNLYGTLGRAQGSAIGFTGGDGVGDVPNAHARAGLVARLVAVHDLAASAYHVCAVALGSLPAPLNEHDGAWCWGNRSSGQTGNGGFAALSYNLPVPVMEVGTNIWGHPNGTGTVSSPAHPWREPVMRVFTGGSSSCFYTGFEATPGHLYCFGSNNRNQIFMGTDVSRVALPRRVVDLPFGIILDVAMGNDYTCVSFTNGQHWCAGLNNNRQIGPASLGNVVTTPVNIAPRMPGEGFQRIVAGGNGVSTCGLNPHPHRGPRVHCWGHTITRPGSEGTPFEIPFSYQ